MVMWSMVVKIDQSRLGRSALELEVLVVVMVAREALRADAVLARLEVVFHHNSVPESHLCVVVVVICLLVVVRNKRRKWVEE